MRDDELKLDPADADQQNAIEQRIVYGVSAVDTWGFSSYLLVVLSNGLQELAENSHGWPQSEKLPNFEDWVKLLQQASDDAHWCLVTFETEESRVHDEFYPKKLEEFQDILEYLNTKLPDEAYAQWTLENKKLADEREMRKDRLMDFIKEYFWALWD